VSAVIFYDGLCGLCNRLNLFVLQRDREGVFRFAALQSDFARQALDKYGVDSGDLTSVYVLVDAGLPTERLLARAGAVLYVLRRFGGIWKAVSLLGLLPDWILNATYDAMARNRYRLLGRYDTCPLPEPEWTQRFIDAGVPASQGL
jgi:predicted DCC family thiol-disulfide oxidoreductase YuxK